MMKATNDKSPLSDDANCQYFRSVNCSISISLATFWPRNVRDFCYENVRLSVHRSVTLVSHA